MQDQTPAIALPALPKGGGAIQSIGSGWGGAGTSGAATFSIPLPVSPGRGYAPPLTLNYRSTVSNGTFGIGWSLSHGCVARRTNKGVPRYDDNDVILGPDGVVWLPERNASGELVFSTVDEYRGLALDRRYQVIRHFPRVEAAFERIERWRADADDPGFWLIHGSDGSLHLYGRNPSSRSTDPDDARRVGEWLLEESMNAHGEHILYQYKGEDLSGLDPEHPRDFRAQCYLSRVRYGNVDAHPWLYLWQPQSIDEVQWHFDLLLDYGERTTELTEKPGYEETAPWPLRSDPHSSFAYGFELGNLRLCRQVLMFHRFAEELGEAPVLVRRLLLDYQDSGLSYSLLVGAHSQAWAADGRLSELPPLNFGYAPFYPEAPCAFSEFDSLPGLNDGQDYQFVDLYGEGMPGVLLRRDQSWYYREPLRDDSQRMDDSRNDRVTYGEWSLLPRLPVADSQRPLRQSLQDLTGDGRLEWCINAPGLNGFFTLGPDRNWSSFVPFAAVAPEALHPLAQLADLSGAGLLDLALIGPRSVRLYANRREHGHAAPVEIRHDVADDTLPVLGDDRAELVAFSDILGTGQQHLVRIRHNEVRCWANLGHGRFGKGFRFASLPFEHAAFDASRVRLADLDGSGAADLLYLESDGVRLFMNRCGHGLQDPVVQPWPPGVRYDRLCQVSAADLQGLGCASLVLTVPHMKPRHWRMDFIAHKPYLLERTDNNMGAVGSVEYRGSSQEWLDEKQELRQAGLPAVCHLPLTLHVVTRQSQLDEITGNLLVQRMQYRRGHYDRHERELRGFGLLLQTDSESARGDEDAHFTAPILSKTWFHTGQYPAPARDDFYPDAEAAELGPDLLGQYRDDAEQIVASPDEAQRRAMAHALAGSPIRSERYGLDDSPQNAVPYSVEQHRYLLRELQPAGAHQPYARMLPLALESMSLDYERQADDPRCQHSVQLAYDHYGQPLHGVVIHCARRRHVSEPPPFDSEHEQTWWRDAHDEAQYNHYLNETRAQAIHLDNAQGWRLGLPWRQRGNALMLARVELPVRQISYEHLLGPESPLHAAAERALTAQTVQRYQAADSATREELPDGQASFEALPGYLESAELNEQAMQAYDRVMSRDELREKLAELNYERMPAFLPEQPDLELWAIRQGYTTYAPASAFHRTLAVRETRSHGLTEVGHDPYHCQVTSVTLPDGCRTLAEFDYHCLQPRRITDPNENIQEALYDGFGRVLASSFHGTEGGEPAGFDPLDDYQRDSEDLAAAIADPHGALQNAASACYYDAFSWMQPVETRQPVHSAVLLADRYPGDPDLQIRISLDSSDGFGRSLQSKQKVEPGMAYAVDENGELRLEDGKPVLIDAAERWRVSERVEYNNKGLPVRVYRPYFAERWRYINDASFRLFGYNDQQFYDPLGREVRVLTAKGYLRRQRYLPWYSISEDENDTWEEMQGGDR